jgi:tetratricopeptide (TPR) repeat protein
MSRDNLLFTIIGILLGFIGGFLLATNISQREATVRATPTQSSQNLPADHPPVGAEQTGESGQQMLASVQTAMKQARENPNDFDAQVTAAKLQYQIGRYDQAIEYLLAANKVKPDDVETLAMLGVANLDAKHYDAAAKWYKAALIKKPDDLVSLHGYAYVLLQIGDIKAAEQTINKLEKIDPTSQDLPQFRSKLAELKAKPK